MSSLRTYDEKRDFKQTAEPKGAKKKSAGKQHIFVIQRHHASRLHYDFRLEVDGVLKSWAVPKGPSMNPSDKRLAMQVEDHPYDYKDFEGVIPEGNYGAGFVYVWDKGSYELLHQDGSSFDKEADKEIREGNLKIRLKGRKVKGEFALVKMKNTDDNAWLLLKHKDDHAVKNAYNSEDFTPQRVKDRGVKEKEKMKGDGKKKATASNAKATPSKAKTAAKPKEEKEPPTPKMTTKKAAATASPAKAARAKEQVVTLNGKKVQLTNQQKLYWPDEQIAKGDLIDYYMEMADYVLPYLKDRPLSLHRFPNGIKDVGFYQKDVDTASAPDWVKTITLHAASASRDVDYLVCNNAATLIYMANLGCIEMNPWLSRVKNLDNPDYIVLDLDPENIAFRHVVETALAIKSLLDEVGVKAFCKTSGASGLHIYVPTGGKYNYETCRLFAEYVAKQVQQALPKITSVIRTKSKRNKKVYIDYMQNSRGQTIASPYSVRPKPGATVSAPLQWDELNDDLAISNFTMENMRDRVKEFGDLWKDIDKTKNDLRKAIDKVESIAQAD